MESTLGADPASFSTLRAAFYLGASGLALPGRTVDLNVCRVHLRLLMGDLEVMWERLEEGSLPAAARAALAVANTSLVVCTLAGDPAGTWRILANARLDRGWGMDLMARRYLRTGRPPLTVREQEMALRALTFLYRWLESVAAREEEGLNWSLREAQAILAIALRFTLESLRCLVRACDQAGHDPERQAFRQRFAEVEGDLDALLGPTDARRPHFDLLKSAMSRWPA